MFEQCVRLTFYNKIWHELLSLTLILAFMPFCFCDLVFGQANVEEAVARVEAAITSYDSILKGKKFVIENKRNRIIAEVNRDPFIARVVVKEFAPDRSGAEVTFGHYISPSIGQCLSASKLVNSKKPETNYILYGVRFVNDKNYFRFLVDYIPILLKIDGQSCLAFFLESEYEPIQVSAGLEGVRCLHPSGINAEFFIDKLTGRLQELNYHIQPGNKLSDGSICTENSWAKFNYQIKWNTVGDVHVSELRASIRAAGGIVGNQVHSVKEVSPLPQDLSTLIELEGFGLENGAPVSCAAHPGRSFQFLDGKVVAVADAESLASAKASRWRNSAEGRIYYYSILVLVLVVSVGVMLWKRR